MASRSNFRTFVQQTKVIGVELEAQLREQRARLGSDALPIVLSAAEAHLRPVLSTPGLFRQDVEPTELKGLQSQVESAYAERRRIDLKTFKASTHATANLLKLYLKQLPRPLLSFELYPYFLAVPTDGDDATIVNTLADLVSRLPDAYLRSVQALLALLHDVTVQNSVLDATELGSVFGPLLLRPVPPATADQTDQARSNWVVAYLITRGNAGGPLAVAIESSRDRRCSVSNVTQQMGATNLTEQDVHWYYIDAQQNYVGPVNNDGLKQLQVHKYVNADTYVWAQHLSGWVQLNTLPDMLADGAATAVPSSPHRGSRDTRGMSAASTGVRDAQASCGGGGRALPSMGIKARQKQQADGEGGGASALGQLQAAGRPPAGTPPAPGAPPTLGSAGLDSKSSVPKPRGLVKIPDMRNAPEAKDAWNGDGMRILTDGRLVRAIIKSDGEVVDGSGVTLAFIEESGEVGSDEMTFLGTFNSGQVINAQETVVGEYDLGKGYVKDPQGSVIAELSKEGYITGNRGQTAGRVEGFSYDQIPKLAAYMCLVDMAFVKGY
ncbi:hypothetical protein AB1Y20_021421 [Prymnesium parvum]|uniref:Rho-GAP domain-containing protein n=1 Tax=Prymnesium parvum TaxID=97485 RepID=A0AB34JM14_PRYPA